MATHHSLCRFLLLALAPLGACGRDSGPEWNVLLITLDTTRADVLGAYGNPIATPAIDAVAREGWVFETAYSTAAVTPVSHASMLTGLNPYRHGLRVLFAESGYRLQDDVPSLATTLRQHGWSTAAVHSAFPVSSTFGLDQGFDVFESFDTEFTKRNGKQAWAVDENQRRSDDTTEIALDVLERAEAPFFLWLHYWDPHDGQIKPPKEYWPDPTQQTNHAWYKAEVQYMDSQLGRVVAALKESGEWERTLVIITADHGEGLGEHGWHFHRLLYDEQIHVPLILRIPGESGGRRVRELATHVDIAPTILTELQLPGAEFLDGVDLRSVAEGGAGLRYAYADQINNYDTNSGVGRQRADDGFLYGVTDGRWKLIYKPLAPQRSELYDLESDSDEDLNLFGTNQSVRDRLLIELASRNSWVTAPFLDPTAPKNAAAQAALEALGYVGGATADSDWAFGCIDHGVRENGLAQEACAAVIASGAGERTCRLPLLLMKR